MVGAGQFRRAVPVVAQRRSEGFRFLQGLARKELSLRLNGLRGDFSRGNASPGETRFLGACSGGNSGSAGAGPRRGAGASVCLVIYRRFRDLERSLFRRCSALPTTTAGRDREGRAFVVLVGVICVVRIRRALGLGALPAQARVGNDRAPPLLQELQVVLGLSGGTGRCPGVTVEAQAPRVV